MKVVYAVFPPTLVELWHRLTKRLYTAYIKNAFKSAGNISIGKGLNLRGGKYITIGDKTGFGKNGVLQAWDTYRGEMFTPTINIGNGCWIGDYFNISAINSINIGDNVLIGRMVSILDNAHGKSDLESLLIHPRDRLLYSKGTIVIEDDVWIGDKVTILPGVKIGKCAIIGANSVVTKDIPSYSIACGAPCKVIKGYDI